MTEMMNNQLLTRPEGNEAERFSIRNDIRASLVKTETGHISNCLENFVLA